MTVLPRESQILASSLALTNGQFTLTAGSPGALVWALQASTDLYNWSDMLMVTNGSGTMTFSLPATNATQSFFRLRLAQ